MTNKELKLAIGWNRINLKILGVWPEPWTTEGIIGTYRFIIPAVLIGVFVGIPQTLALYRVSDDVTMTCEILSTAWLPCINSFTKVLVVRYHRKVMKLTKIHLQKALRSLLESFYNNWAESYPEDAHEIMLRNARKAKKISVGCTVITQAMVTSFIFMRTIQIIAADRINDDQIHLLIYKGHVPLDMSWTPTLILGNLGQIAAAYSGAISYTGVDSFLCMLVIHVCAVFNTLELRLTKLFAKTSLRKDESVDAFRKELGSIVKKHESLIWYVGTLEESFNHFMLFQMVLCTLQICIQAFQVFTIVQAGTGNFIVYLFFFFLITFIVSHVYLYCYMGEMLLIQNTRMAESAYNASWYDSRNSEAKNILILMCRATVPLRLTAGKFGTFSMEMFSGILRTAMGYLSALLTIANIG